MELELKFAELACCEPVGDLVTTQEESMETAIPEYCPDIARIVDTVGQLRLREKHPAGQQLTMGGSVVLTVLSLGTRVALAYALAGPVGESRTPPLLRISSDTPSSSSREFIMCVSPDWV